MFKKIPTAGVFTGAQAGERRPGLRKMSKSEAKPGIFTDGGTSVPVFPEP
jgi:hypothetical protein